MDNRVSRWRTVLMGGVALIGVVGWSALQPRDEDVVFSHMPVSSPKLAPLLPYAAPAIESDHSGDESADVEALRRDPFDAPQVEHAEEPAVAHGPATPPLRLSVSATLVTGSRRAAIINDRLVYVGDSIPGGGRLTAVDVDRVTVTAAGGATHVLTVKEGGV